MLAFLKYTALIAFAIPQLLRAEPATRPAFGYYQTQWSQWGSHASQTNPLPGLRTIDACPPPSTDLPEQLMNEVASNVTTIPQVARTGEILGNVLLRQVLNERDVIRRTAKADQIVKGILDNAKRVDDFDIGSGFALAGELARYASPATQTLIKAKLLHVTGWLQKAENYQRYAQDEDALHDTIDSAMAGLESMARARLLSYADKAGLARLRKVPALAHLIEASLETSSAEERRTLIREAFNDGAKEGLTRLRLAAYRMLAKHVPDLDPESLQRLETAFVDTVQTMKEQRARRAANPQLDAEEEETAANGASFLSTAAQSFAAHPETARAIERVLANAGAHLPNGVRNFQELATRSYQTLSAAENLTQRQLRTLILTELGPLALRAGVDVIGAIDPTSACNIVGICLDVAQRDYLSAAISAVAMVPAWGKLASTLKLGRRGLQLQRLAQSALALMTKLNRLRQRVEAVANVAGIAVEGVRQLSQGELPLNEEMLGRVLELSLGRRRLGSNVNLIRDVVGDARRLHAVLRSDDPSLASMADGLLSLPPRDGQPGCRVSPLDRAVAGMRERVFFPMNNARRNILDRTERVFQRVLPQPVPFGRDRGFVVRGAMPDDEPPPGTLEETVAQRLNLDAIGRWRLRELIAKQETSPSNYAEMFALGLAAED